MQIVTLSDAEWSAIFLSLKVALWAMVGSLPFGIVCALVLARGQFRGKAILHALVHLPLVLPPVVTGYVLLYSFGKKSAIGQFLYDYLNFSFSFRWTGAALACAVMGFPLMVRAISLSISAVDRKLEAAASTLGASPIWVILTITLPLALPGILAGMVLSFAKAMGEFGATITFVSNIPGETQTLPTLIYTYTQVPEGDASVWRLTLISVFISMAALLVSEFLAARATGRLST
ncbi:MAG: molybdate ABC transporter permease subunit [Alphaproteobacteria bacterium]|nr:molybdate ABC transporter permease subunit [Alphaproteobacteria bacterium]